jgi:membrane protein DedA with SNARE-associated domain
MKALIDFVVKLFYTGIFLAGFALLVLGGITILNGPVGAAASCALGGLFVMWLSYCTGKMWQHCKADTDWYGLKQ